MTKSLKLRDMTIGKRITELRQKKGLSMNQLAKLVGVSPVQISNYERDLQLPTAINLSKIAKEFDTSTDFLIEGDSLSVVEKLVPLIKKLPKGAQSNIVKYIKDQIYLSSHQNLDKQLLKELDFKA